MFSFVIGTIQIYDDDDDECGFGLNKTKQTKNAGYVESTGQN